MIRSIFIGFLILSALTTKGAEAQITESTNAAAVTLKDIFSVVSSRIDQAAVSSYESNRFSGYNSFSSINSRVPSVCCNGGLFAVTPSSYHDTGLGCFFTLQDSGASGTDEGMYRCRSGLSPPC